MQGLGFFDVILLLAGIVVIVTAIGRWFFGKLDAGPPEIPLDEVEAMRLKKMQEATKVIED